MKREGEPLEGGEKKKRKSRFSEAVVEPQPVIPTLAPIQQIAKPKILPPVLGIKNAPLPLPLPLAANIPITAFSVPSELIAKAKAAAALQLSIAQQLAQAKAITKSSTQGPYFFFFFLLYI